MTTAEYNSCVELYADNVYRFILKNCKDEELAKDVIQDAFEKMWNKKATIESDKARSYLFTTAHHTLIDAIRKNKYSAVWEDSHENNFYHEQQYSDINEILEKALATLPAIQRSAILLRDYEGYSYDEIGQITGLNESQVKVYIYRARVALKEYIGQLERVI